MITLRTGKPGDGMTYQLWRTRCTDCETLLARGLPSEQVAMDAVGPCDECGSPLTTFEVDE